MDQAEQLRIIKANKQIRPTARVITVTSGKGGVGKSNMSINLAIQFRKMGKRVVILDADFGLANIEIMFGAVPKHNLCDLVYEGKSISDIITQGPMGVGFISGGSGIAGMSNLGKDALTCIIQNLAELDALTDVIIEFLVASGEVLLVTTPEPTSITDSYSLLKALYRHPRYEEAYTKVKMVANRVENVKEGQVLFDKLNAVVTRYLKTSMEYLGCVPQDPQVVQAVMQQVPVSIQNPGAKSSQAYQRIAEKLCDKTQEEQPRRGMAAFFSHIIGTRNGAAKQSR